MAGPGDEIAAAEGRGHGGLRASHADREQVIDVLKAAFVAGRLTKDDHGQQHTAEAAHPRSPGSQPAPQGRLRGYRYTIGYAAT